MKILLKYLKPYRGLVLLALLLTINQTFSLFDPMIFGKVIDLFANSPHKANDGTVRTEGMYISGIMFYLLCWWAPQWCRIAKAFQDYFSNVIIQKFGAKIFTDGLKYSMRLPYQDFEDQRSGENASVLNKVRADTEKFISNFINVVFGILVSVVFCYHLLYKVALEHYTHLFWRHGYYRVCNQPAQQENQGYSKNIVKETNALAGLQTESLRNIELVKSL